MINRKVQKVFFFFNVEEKAENKTKCASNHTNCKQTELNTLKKKRFLVGFQEKHLKHYF